MTITGHSLSDNAMAYDGLQAFAPANGRRLTLVNVHADPSDALSGLHLVLNAPAGAGDPVFSIDADHEDFAAAIRQGRTRGLSRARAAWENPQRGRMRPPECVVIPFPNRAAPTAGRAEAQGSEQGRP